MDKKLFRSYILLITYAVLLVAAWVRMDWLSNVFMGIISIVMPIIVGLVIAFVLNGPYVFFSSKLKKVLKAPKVQKLVNPLSLIGVYVLLFAVVIGIFSFLIPQLATSIQILVANMDNYTRTLQNLINQVMEYLQITNIQLADFNQTIEKLLGTVTNVMGAFAPHLLNFTTGVFRGVGNFVLGLIISIYLLADKKRLVRQMAQILYAYVPHNIADRSVRIGKLTSRTFAQFVTGQLTEAVILGTLCFLGMSVFQFEYALLISTMIAITSLIPVAGAFIGCVPSVFLLLMVKPSQALWFLVFIIILQQLEGNLIYPRVVGGSIGLPSLWVLLSIIIGGGVGGIVGMLVGVPIMSVLYQILGKDSAWRIARKKEKALAAKPTSENDET